MTIPHNPGSGLFAVSVLSGFVYGGLFILPPYCEIDPVSQLENKNESQLNTLKSGTTSSLSTLFASSSVLERGVVCCSTSIVALISPAFAAALVPIAPILIVFSPFFRR